MGRRRRGSIAVVPLVVVLISLWLTQRGPGRGSVPSERSTGRAPSKSPQGLEPRTDVPGAQPQGRGLTCTVAAVPDGDTLRCEDGTRIRLLSIDSPELAQEPFGNVARDELRILVPRGAQITLETDAQERDRFGRVLAYAYAEDGRMVNEEMARAGYAVALVYPPNVRYAKRIRAAVEEAQNKRRGLWAKGGFACAPRDYRAGRCGGGSGRHSGRS